MINIYLLSPTQFQGVYPLPTIEIEFFQKSVNFSNVDYLILTSKNGVRAINHISQEWREKEIFAVGRKTADEVEKFGGKLIEVANGYGKELIDIIKSKYAKKRFLYIRPKEVTIDFKQELDNFVKFKEEILYQTKCKEYSQILEKSIVIATSPSTVKCLLKKEVPKETIFIAIGKTTLKAIPDKFKKFQAHERTIESCYQLAKTLTSI